MLGLRLALLALLLSLGLAAPTTSSASSVAAPASAQAPTRSLSVSGDGVRMFPEFRLGTERYAVASTDATSGRVKVSASTSDPTGSVLVNGRPGSGTRTITGLSAGDEISVIFEDAGGRSVHSLIYLPAGFPVLERTTPENAQVAPGHVLLGLGDWSGGSFFETAVDRNGVPVHLHEEQASSMDFKRQPNGQLTVSRHSAHTPGRDGSAVVVLDESLEPVRTYETKGLVHTDGHDSLLLPDGRRFLLAYEPNKTTGKIDSVIQGLSADGTVFFEWNSADHVDIPNESVDPDNSDYAHINSVVLTEDQNLLASFRHFSAVFKIALRTEAGHEQGDVLWRLGGHRSDFTFPGDEHYGPCAQHTASELPDGNILIFDNGSYGGIFDELCVDPANPGSGRVSRQFSRVTEYEIDEAAGTATLVSSFTEPERAALFAGGVVELPNRNRLINWASSRTVTATELSPTGEKIWELADTNPDTNSRLFSYRAALATIEDTDDPEVRINRPDPGDTYGQDQRLPLRFSCTDRGGSSLQSCEVTGGDGRFLDTSRVGEHTVTITATDGAGRTTSKTVTYQVVSYRPDALVKKRGARYKGDDVYGAASRQQVKIALRRTRQTRTSFVRFFNDSSVRDRFTIRGPQGGGKFRSRYLRAGRNVTTKVAAGRLRTPVLDPGESYVLKVRTTRRPAADPGDSRRFKVRARSIRSPRRKDTVGIVVRAR